MPIQHPVYKLTLSITCFHGIGDRSYRRVQRTPYSSLTALPKIDPVVYTDTEIGQSSLFPFPRSVGEDLLDPGQSDTQNLLSHLFNHSTRRLGSPFHASAPDRVPLKLPCGHH
jgi:hypothetical protein